MRFLVARNPDPDSSLPYLVRLPIDMLARVQVRYPEIHIVFAETRPLAEEWTFRYLGAAAAEDLEASS